MSAIQAEILRKFPEAAGSVRLDGTDGDYVAASDLAEWVSSGGIDPGAPEQVARLRSFAEWCCSQPDGRTSDDDVGTIYMVGFFETLCGTSAAPSLIPKLVDRDYLVASADYFKRWVGEAKYDCILGSGWG